MILHLPQGYDTPLGDGGAGLSGGQKQRLGLARAMYGDPALLVLDEPNSNLDDVGEMALVQAIQDLRQRGKTIILITHRTSVIGVTNKLLMLREGTVAAFGPTRDVLAALQEQNQKAAEAQRAAQQAAMKQQLGGMKVNVQGQAAQQPQGQTPPPPAAPQATPQNDAQQAEQIAAQRVAQQGTPGAAPTEQE
jgi:ATP-binding cassette subfamily C exporter for protease/lipase